MPVASDDIIKGRYDRIAAWYDWLDAPMERMVSPWRQDAIAELYGRVLEVGVGTGANVPFYVDDLDVTAIDFSSRMLEKARAKFGNRRNVTFMQMDAQELAFADNVFDCVLTSCVFCSVPNPLQGLKEIRRVCKAGGKIVMIEHVRSKGPWLGRLMDLMNPIPLHIYGANINRRTVEELQVAGFRAVDIEATDLWRDVFKKIVIHNQK